MFYKDNHRPIFSSNSPSFTLIELLVVIAILAVLMSVVVITINPAEMLKKTRDSKRVSDLDSLRTALNFYLTDANNFPTNVCDNSSIYVSLPSNNTNCSDLNLPPLPTGYSYKCVTNDNLRKINGSGWLPLNLANISTGAPISTLPVDPKNTVNDSLYYTFYCNSLNQYILTDYVESTAYGPKGTNAVTNKDGGSDPYVYEVGNNLFISPLKPVGSWSFDEGSGTVAVDSSGNNNNGTLINGPTWTTGQVNNALSFDGSDDHVNIGTGASLNPGLGSWTVEGWIFNRDYTYPKTQIPIGGYNTYSGAHWCINNGFNSNGITVDWSDGTNYLTQGLIAFDSGYKPNDTKNKWTHIVVVFDRTAGKAYGYVNGVKQSGSADISSITGNITNPNNNIGNVAGWKIDGLIDEVRIYNRALSAQEIKRHYEKSK